MHDWKDQCESPGVLWPSLNLCLLLWLLVLPRGQPWAFSAVLLSFIPFLILFLFYFTRQGKAILFTQQIQHLLTFGGKKSEEKSQRSFNIMVFEYLKTVSVGNVDRLLVRLPSEPSAHYLHSERESSSLQGASQGTDLLFSLPACPLLSWYSHFQENLIRSQRWGWGEVGSKMFREELSWRPGWGDPETLVPWITFAVFLYWDSAWKFHWRNKTRQNRSQCSPMLESICLFIQEAELNVGLEP